MSYGQRFRSRIDSDQAAVCKILRSNGWSVEIIGHPVDLVIGKYGVTLLAEIKAEPGPRGGISKKGQKLNEDQEAFFKNWKGSVVLLRLSSCLFDAEASVGNVKP